MILGFNAWEVQADRKDFGTSPIPHVDGSDFWMTRFKVPEDVYEVNFVITDCEGKFENNAGQDFTYLVEVRGVGLPYGGRGGAKHNARRHNVSLSVVIWLGTMSTTCYLVQGLPGGLPHCQVDSVCVCVDHCEEEEYHRSDPPV
jgi:hypothetical protein